MTAIKWIFVLSLLVSSVVFADNENVWDNFLNNPSIDNYIRCEKEIQKSISGKYERFKSPAYLGLEHENRFDRLLALIERGNNYAVELGLQVYPLFSRSASKLEFLNIALGSQISSNPERLLSLLKKYSVKYGEGNFHLEGIIANYGSDYTDCLDAQLTETDKRISALRLIKDMKLTALRDYFINYLVEHKKEIVEARESIPKSILDRMQETCNAE